MFTQKQIDELQHAAARILGIESGFPPDPCFEEGQWRRIRALLASTIGEIDRVGLCGSECGCCRRSAPLQYVIIGNVIDLVCGECAARMSQQREEHEQCY